MIISQRARVSLDFTTPSSATLHWERKDALLLLFGVLSVPVTCVQPRGLSYQDTSVQVSKFACFSVMVIVIRMLYLVFLLEW